MVNWICGKNVEAISYLARFTCGAVQPPPVSNQDNFNRRSVTREIPNLCNVTHLCHMWQRQLMRKLVNHGWTKPLRLADTDIGIARILERDRYRTANKNRQHPPKPDSDAT